MNKRNLEKESLVACLAWCSLRALPDKYDGKNVYIKAVAKVMKTNGSISYVAMQKDINGEDKIVKDFGMVASIGKVLEVYPYLFLDASFMPTFKSLKKDERVEYLSEIYKDKDFSKMSARELDKVILNHAIQEHLNAVKNNTFNV